MKRLDYAGEEPIEPLTRRERVVLLYLAEEKSNSEIAALETLSLNSVKWQEFLLKQKKQAVLVNSFRRQGMSDVCVSVIIRFRRQGRGPAPAFLIGSRFKMNLKRTEPLNTAPDPSAMIPG